MRFKGVRPLKVVIALILVAMVSAPGASLVSAQADPPACSHYYTVRPGDTWNTVAAKADVPVTEIRRANSQAVRPNGWLYVGDRLCIPAQTQTQDEGYWYKVQRGDTWNTVSKATGVPVRQLWNANAALLNARLWLYVGQSIRVPGPKPVAPPAGEAQGSSGQAAEMTPTATATPVPTATPTPTAAATAVGGAAAASRCPAAFDDYPDAILVFLNTPGNTPDGLRTWLASCKAIIGGAQSVSQAALQTPRSADVIVSLHDPAHPPPDGSGMLLVYHAGTQGYTLAHQAKSTGSVALIDAADINADGRVDVIWADTTCGARTCFSTLFVDSWTGKAYEDWVDGEPTMASAEFRFEDVAPEGSDQEILIHGGVIGSVGAGPQRPWTEMYLSEEGAAYRLHRQQYDPSRCLYHAILDANTMFNSWKTEGFEAAAEAYQAALNDKTAVACGNIQDELTTLRDFARFRLVVSQVAAGQVAQAQKSIGQIKTPALAGAAKTFYDAYRSSGSVIQACRDATMYAQKTPSAWQFLSDWGYANPSFAPEDLCPLG